MIRADVINLIDQSPSGHGLFEATTETTSTVYCTVKSVGMNEFYRAKEYGLAPSIVFTLTDAADYAGQKFVTWNGKLYEVIRTYQTGLGIELTCEEAKIYAITT